MITVMLGTNPYSFDRLVKPVDELCGKNGWNAFVQLGNTKYTPLNMKYANFVPRDVLMNYIRKSDVVICQGGFGSIRDALSCDKPVVAVPRRREFGESPDDQVEMVREMEKEGYVIAVYDINGLEEAISKARDFDPVKRPKSRIPQIINEFLSNNVKY